MQDLKQGRRFGPLASGWSVQGSRLRLLRTSACGDEALRACLVDTLRRSLTRSPETETSTITEPEPEPKPCTLDLAAVVGRPTVPACPGPSPRCGETPHELRLTDDTLALQGNGTCSTTQGDRSAACPRPLCRAPSIASCLSEASCVHDLELAEPHSATLSTEGLPHSDDPFASWHDPEPYEELPESRPASTSVRTSVTPSISGSINGFDDSGYLSDGTVSTVPPSYRTYRPSIPNLLDHPLPLRPLPSLPSEAAVPPSAYPGAQRLRVVNGPGLPSTPRSSLAVQRSLTDLRGIQRQKTRNGLPRKSVDGGVRLDGLELPPAYGDPGIGTSNS